MIGRTCTRRRPTRSAWLLAAVLLAVSCRTVPIGDPLVSEVPQNLSRDDATVAIVAMLTAPSYLKTDQKIFERVVANPVGEALWGRYSLERSLAGWLLESWEPERLLASYRARVHYLRLAVEIAPRTVTIWIDGSNNLMQSDRRIHKRAKIWIRNFESAVRRVLERASAEKRELGSPSQ